MRVWSARRSAAFAGSLAIFTGACAGSSINAPQSLKPLPEPVDAVALAPSGGVLADAIGTELLNRGIRVLDTQQTSAFLLRLNLDETELLRSGGLDSLREMGIRGVLSCTSVVGYDNKPQSATVRVVSTKTGEVVAALDWENGRGGQKGSVFNRMVRKDILSAAHQIGGALATQLGRH